MELENGAACELVSGLIIQYIDGELDEGAAELVERHIEVCADCRKLYCDLRAVCRAAADAAYPVPAELHTRVMAAVRAEKSTWLRTRLLKRVSTYAGIGIAAVLCVFIGAAAVFNNLGKNADLSGGFSEKLADGGTEASALFQYSFNRIAAPEDDGLRYESIGEVTGRGSETGENECWYDEKPTECTISESDSATPKSVNPPDAETVTATTCDKPGSLPYNTDMLVGEWELTAAGGKPVKLTLCHDQTFNLVDTGGGETAGNYTVSGDLISFSYPGGNAEYRFCLDNYGLGLSYVSGNDIIK